MNLRILKKLSKRAVPLLQALDRSGQYFKAEKYDNHLSMLIVDRTDWERQYCRPDYEAYNRYSGKQGAPVKFTTRTGRTMVMSPPTCPKKGTPMIGAMSGYYEPEWDEQTAWEALVDIVHWHYMKYPDFEGMTEIADAMPTPTRVLVSPSDYLKAAQDMIEEKND